MCFTMCVHTYICSHTVTHRASIAQWHLIASEKRAPMWTLSLSRTRTHTQTRTRTCKRNTRGDRPGHVTQSAAAATEATLLHYIRLYNICGYNIIYMIQLCSHSSDTIVVWYICTHIKSQMFHISIYIHTHMRARIMLTHTHVYVCAGQSSKGREECAD